jgi:hypothetical protein
MNLNTNRPNCSIDCNQRVIIFFTIYVLFLFFVYGYELFILEPEQKKLLYLVEEQSSQIIALKEDLLKAEISNKDSLVSS